MSLLNRLTLIGLTISCTMISIRANADCDFSSTNPVPTVNFESLRHQAGVSAVGYVLVHRDHLITSGASGYYTQRKKKPVSADSLFRVGSITKTLTAIAALKLAEEGKLDLNRSVSSIEPGLPLTSPFPERPVTTAMLLEHTAGLTDMSQREFSSRQPLSLAQALRYDPSTKAVRWTPGYHVSYSNIGAGYVGRIIEAIVGDSYDSWFNAKILAPLAMHDSQLHWDPVLQTRLVTGYNTDLVSTIPYWHTLYRPFGELNTTSNDMARLLSLMLNRGTLGGKHFLSSSSILKMEQRQTGLSKNPYMLGYALGLDREEVNSHFIYSHYGDADGYLAKFAYSNDCGLGYFVVINAFNHQALSVFVDVLDNWLVAGLPKKPPAPAIQLKPAEIAALSGRYRRVTYRFPWQKESTLRQTIDIAEDKGRWYLRYIINDHWREIIPVAPHLFREVTDHYASIAIMQADDGETYLAAPFGNFIKMP